MEAAHANDTWQHWFEAYGPKLLFCARQWTRSLADAEDIVQEAFVRYWRHQRQLPGDPQALIITSIRRAAIDHARRTQLSIASCPALRRGDRDLVPLRGTAQRPSLIHDAPGQE